MNKKNLNQLSIVIITLNEEENIVNILSDLEKQTFRSFEIIISDSNSSDRTADKANSMAHKFSEFRFKNCGRTLGPSFGRNFGERFAKYERLLFLDADIRIRNPNFLGKMMKLIKKNNLDAGSMYFKLTSKGIIPFCSYKIINFGLFVTQFFSPTACGAFLFSTKTVHKKIGGFREDISLCEDCDYVRDAKIKKFKIRMIPMNCEFSDRRLRQDGFLKMGIIYLKANIIRFVTKKSVKNIKYSFDKYSKS